jgi:putative transposase
MRSVMDAILYIASSGCRWRMVLGDCPPVSTVRGYFYAWRAIGLGEAINQLLVMTALSLREEKLTQRQRSLIARASKPTKAAEFLVALGARK